MKEWFKDTFLCDLDTIFFWIFIVLMIVNPSAIWMLLVTVFFITSENRASERRIKAHVERTYQRISTPD